MKSAMLALLAMTLGPRSSLASAPEVTLARTPSWVEEMELPKEQPPPSDVRSGAFYLIVDRQIRVAAGSTERYHRRAWKVLSTAGVQEASEIKVSFDPSYQSLAFHEIRLWRNGRNVRTFSRSDVTVVHEESDLSERIYNGALSAIVFLKDVRPGDIVDYSYTVAGANPIFDGRFAAVFNLAFDFPVARLRNRLIWPSGRTLFLKAHRTDLLPQERESSGNRIYVWERHDVPAVRSEDDTPGWFDPEPYVDASEFASWSEVARWATRLFSRSGGTSPRLAAVVSDIGKAPQAERATRAIRFVQDEVRYLGLEMGPSSHQPHSPERVLEQRYGDCKDKALLLVALLRALGIDATPALVNTSVGRGLDERLPSPFAFDHAIVVATIEGTPVWIDATRSETGGAPSAIEPPPFERALLVREDAVGLTSMPPPQRPAPTLVVEEAYALGAAGKPARLVVKTTYRGRDADEKRQSLARVSPAELAERYLNRHAHEDPAVRSLALPVSRDDRAANVIVEEERYELPGFWKEGHHDFYAWAVGDELRRPATASRSMPLQLNHPIHLEHTLTIDLPEPLELEPQRELVVSPGFSLGSRSELHGRRVTLSYDYRSLDSSLPASEAQRHFEAVDRAERALGYRVDLSWRVPGSGRSNGGSGVAWVAIGLIAMTAAGLGGFGLRAVRRRRRAQAFGPPRGLAPGELPARPLLSGPDGVALAAHLASRACACGVRGRLTPTERHNVTYDAKSMAVVTCHCGACGKEQALYVLFG
jgi:transglutaminase-like putative cysteine protease